jgi:hypothetical protein
MFPILRRSCVADMVPVDVCINLMCVLGWKAASQPASTTPVYNCTSGGINPITWGQVEAWGLQTLVDNPYQDVFWYPGGSYKENWYLNRFFQVFRISSCWKCFHIPSRPKSNKYNLFILQLLFHYGPAHCVDLLCRLSGRKPFLVKISNMMQKSTKVTFLALFGVINERFSRHLNLSPPTPGTGQTTTWSSWRGN